MKSADKQRRFIKLWRHDLWSDQALQSCSKPAQWLWIKLFTTVMEDATPYGHLVINGKAATITQLSRIAGESAETVRQWMQELAENGVYSRNSDGAIFSRKMIALAQLEDVRRKAGQLGGNPALLPDEDNHKDKHRDKPEVNQKDNQDLKPRVKSKEERRKSKRVQKKVPPKPPKGGLLVDAEDLKRFEAFWAIYPKKVAKPDAIKRWAKIRPDQALTDRIIAAVQQHCRSLKWLKDDGDFIPHPASWLHREQWNDQLTMPTGRATTSAADTKKLIAEYRQVEAEIDAQRKAKEFV